MAHWAQFVCISAVFLFESSAAPIVTVQLDKQYVPLKRGDRVVAHKTAYFGSLFVGTPAQRFTVVFDTGSGHLFLPSSSCASSTCLKHKRYDLRASTSAVVIDHDGKQLPKHAKDRDQVSISFGTGDVIGEFVQEVVCLSEHSENFLSTWQRSKDCIKVRVITASEMTDEPFSSFAFDGVLGLGLSALAVDPEFSYFGQMVKTNILPQPRFGFFLSSNDEVPSEISFGGHDERKVSGEPVWVPVVQPELGYWQVSIKSLRIGGVSLPICDTRKCVGIVDSGTSLLGVPSRAIRDVHMKLARKVVGDPPELDCRQVGGLDMVFDLGGFEVALGPEDYSRPLAMRVQSNATGKTQVVCRASLLPVDMGAEESDKPLQWILGEPVLRKYYTAFDWKRQEIGFAIAKQPLPSEMSLEGSQTATHSVLGAPSAKPQAPVNLQI